MNHRLIKCGICGTVFRVPCEPRFNRVKYCCEACRREAKQEQDRRARERYNKQYKPLKKYLGNSIKSHRNADFKKELKTVENELRRLRLKR